MAWAVPASPMMPGGNLARCGAVSSWHKIWLGHMSGVPRNAANEIEDIEGVRLFAERRVRIRNVVATCRLEHASNRHVATAFRTTTWRSPSRRAPSIYLRRRRTERRSTVLSSEGRTWAALDLVRDRDSPAPRQDRVGYLQTSSVSDGGGVRALALTAASPATILERRRRCRST